MDVFGFRDAVEDEAFGFVPGLIQSERPWLEEMLTSGSDTLNLCLTIETTIRRDIRVVRNPQLPFRETGVGQALRAFGPTQFEEIVDD